MAHSRKIYDALDDLLLPYRFSLILFDGNTDPDCHHPYRGVAYPSSSGNTQLANSPALNAALKNRAAIWILSGKFAHKSAELDRPDRGPIYLNLIVMGQLKPVGHVLVTSGTEHPGE